MKSFLEGRQTVSRSGLPVARSHSQLPNLGQPANDISASAPAGMPPSSKRAHGEKKIETVEVDGIVQKIVVTCSCGEKIEVHCGY
jgi:hypothetical protein